MPPVVNHNDPSMRRMVQVAGWVAAVVGALVALLLLREEQPQWNRLALNLCVAGVGATTLVALHLGRQALAAGLLVWGVGCGGGGWSCRWWRPAMAASTAPTCSSTPF